MIQSTKRYQHRIGVRAEICFDIESETQVLTKEELRTKILAVIGDAQDEDEGYDLPEPLIAGRAYVAWQFLTGNSHDPGGAEAFELYDTWEVEARQTEKQ